VIVNVCTGPLPAFAERAATALESIPPDRNTPTGTSLIRCWLAAVASSRAIASRLSEGRGSVAGMRQYAFGRGSAASSPISADVPSGSERIPATIDGSPLTKPFQA
jgi:hypothetical protein